jgi:hypothetical protein
MVSTDHYRHELLSQMRRAAALGQASVLITASDLCGSILHGHISAGACCDAMQDEIKYGDTIVLERGNPAGMAVRYCLPRNAIVIAAKPSTLDGTQNIGQLTVIRQDILASGNGWADFTEQQSVAGMDDLTEVETAIVVSPHLTDADRLGALAVLLDSDDESGFADDFKNRLFASLRPS